MKQERLSPKEFYEREVLPKLTVEAVYSEVDFTRRQGRYWRGPCPLHKGDDSNFSVDTQTLGWTCFSRCGHGSALDYLNHGEKNFRGRDYVERVKDAARLAGVDLSPIERELTPEEEKSHQKRLRREDLLEAFHALTRDALRGEDKAAQKAREYLKSRGFEDPEDIPLGLCPPLAELKTKLTAQGFTKDELAPLEKDRRWEGRLVIPWRDRWGQIGTFATRDLTGQAEDGQKYLYLSGASKPDFCGLDVALKDKTSRENLVLVEGLLDVISLQSRGFPNVAALGGGGRLLTADRWERLAGFGVKAVTLALDNDEAGREGLLAAIENASKASNVPNVYVVDPAELGEYKDPDAFVREKDLEAFRSLLEGRVHAFRFLARSLVEKHKPGPTWTDPGLGAALDEAIAVDESVTAPEKLLDLERFFWPEIIEATEADEDALAARREAAREKQTKERERREYSALIRDAGQKLKDEGAEAVKRLLREGVDRLRAEERIHKAEPVLSIADELEVHEARLEKWRGRELIGLAQKTLPRLDEYTMGLRGLMLLAAAPNVGKTALAVQLGVDVVTHNPDACFLFLSLEMSRWDILTRIKCRLAEMDWKTLVLEENRTSEEVRLLSGADEALRRIGSRIRILDERNFPAPTTEKVLASLEDLKARTGATRAFVLVDYLQVWPIPPHESKNVRSELDADKWRVGAMKTLRDATEGGAVLVISEARKPSGSAESWGEELAEVMGSARGTYTPDAVFLFKALTEKEAGQNKEALERKGEAHYRLRIAKGRDGFQKKDLELVFRYRRATFEERD